MKKRVLSLLLGGLLIFSCLSFVGCGEDSLKESNDEWFERATENQRELEELEDKLK